MFYDVEAIYASLNGMHVWFIGIREHSGEIAG